MLLPMDIPLGGREVSVDAPPLSSTITNSSTVADSAN